MSDEITDLNEVRNNIGNIIIELENIGQFDIAMRLKDEMNNITRITNI